MSGSHWNETDFDGESDGEADVPILLPVPFQELSSVQYFSIEEQLTQLTAALKGQFGRHCFIKIHHEKTQPLRVPLVKAYRTSSEASAWYEAKLLAAEGAQPFAIVDAVIQQQDQQLRRLVAGSAPAPPIASLDESPLWADLLGRE
jgi:hypothetical protein